MSAFLKQSSRPFEKVIYKTISVSKACNDKEWGTDKGQSLEGPSKRVNKYESTNTWIRQSNWAKVKAKVKATNICTDRYSRGEGVQWNSLQTRQPFCTGNVSIARVKGQTNHDTRPSLAQRSREKVNGDLCRQCPRWCPASARCDVKNRRWPSGVTVTYIRRNCDVSLSLCP